MASAVDSGRVRSLGRLGFQPGPCSGPLEPQFPYPYNGLGRDGRPHPGNGALCHPSLNRRWRGGGGWGRSQLPGKPSSQAPTTRRDPSSTSHCRYLAGGRLLEGGGGIRAWGLLAPQLVCSAPRMRLWLPSFWLRLSTAHHWAQTSRAFSSVWRQCRVRSWPCDLAD